MSEQADSYQFIQELVFQLEDESTAARVRAIRHLAAIADPRSIPPITRLYLDEDQPDAVRRAAADALGVFKAIKEAVDKGEAVQLPDPLTVKGPPRVSPKAFRRLLSLLAVLLVLLIAADVVLVISQGGFSLSLGGGQASTVDEVGEQFYATLDNRYNIVSEEVTTMRGSWEMFRDTGALDCGIGEPDERAINADDLNVTVIAYSDYPALHDAKLRLSEAITQFSLVYNDWYLACRADTVVTDAATGLARLDGVAATLAQAQALLAQARVSLDAVAGQTPAVEEPPVEAGGDTGDGPDAPPLATPGDAASGPGEDAAPTEAPTMTPLPTETPIPTATDVPVDYRRYINGMRARIDTVLVGRGAARLLETYWADVRATGTSAGCGQPIDDADFADYDGLPVEEAARDQRLGVIAAGLNSALGLARDSLASFRQGCEAGTLGSAVNVGQQQIQQAILAFEQVSAQLDGLEAEVSP